MGNLTCIANHLRGSYDPWQWIQGGLYPLGQRDDDRGSNPLLPVPPNLPEDLPGVGGGQAVDDNVGVPDGLLQVGDDLERAERRVDHVEAEAVPEYLVGVERAVPQARLDVLEVGAAADEAAQDVLARVDDLEEVLGGGAVDGAAGAAPDADLRLVAEVAVRVLQQRAEDAAPRARPDADDPERVPVRLPQLPPQLVQLLRRRRRPAARVAPHHRRRAQPGSGQARQAGSGSGRPRKMWWGFAGDEHGGRK